MDKKEEPGRGRPDDFTVEEWEDLQAVIREPTPDRPLDALAFDHRRLMLLDHLRRTGYCELTEDKQYVIFTQHPVFEHGDESVEYFFKGMLPWRDLLTSSGRFERKVVKAIRDEWRQTGKIRFE